MTLDVIVARHLQGLTPEQIHESFPSVPLTDIYAVVSYYLAHREEIDAYIQRRDEEAAQIRAAYEAAYPPKVTKAELLARYEQIKREKGKA